ncbi:MAG: hypothetical protein ACK4FM_01925 [Caldimicrobium sp.]
MTLFLNILFIIFFSFSSLYAQVSSKVLEEIKRDYQPLSGLLIALDGNEVIIDKGKAHGVKPKDIFVVYKKVRKIIHPETKESLGFLKEPIGKIEILRVDENFATGRILSKKEEFPVPTPVKRNTDLRIMIISENESPFEDIFITLKNLLPECEIFFEPKLTFKQITSSDLFTKNIDYLWVVGEGYIKIYNSYLDLIRAYATPTPLREQPKVLATPKVQKEVILPSQPSLFYPSQINLVGKMPGEALQVEYVDLNGDGNPEIVYFTTEGLFIVQLRGPLLAQYKPEKGEILSFSLGPSGWIALNVYEKNIGMRSEILKYTSEGLNPVIKNLNLILQFVDYVGTGEKDTLLAQTFDSDNFWGKDVYIIKREGTSIRYVQRLEVPENFRLIGSDFADLDSDGIRELITFLPDGRLGIYKNTKLVFSTPFSVTKHFYQLILSKGKKDKEVIKVKVSPLPNFIVKDFNGDGLPDILLVKADFPLERIAKDLKTLPLNQGTFQFYLLSYQGTFYFRTLPIQETGIFTGVGALDRYLYFSTIKGIYPGQTESVIYSILY